MKRIMIIGGSGSGKSTLARDLSAVTDLPVVHIDPMYWKPNWVQREKSETHELVLEATAKDRWVFDGNHHSTFPERLARADHLIFLDFPTWLRLVRIINRTFRFYGKTRPDMGAECPERFDWEFISVWVAGYRRRSRDRDLEVVRTAPDTVKTIHLKSRKEVSAFLREVAHQNG